MRRLILPSSFVLWTLSLLMLSACSGGGGSGGDDSGSTHSAETGVRILHAAIDGEPVDLISSQDPGKILERSAFADSQVFASLGAGPQRLSLLPARVGGSELFGFDIEVAKGSRRSVLLFGDHRVLGLRATILEDGAFEKPVAGECFIRIVHALVGAHQLQVSSDLGPEFAPIIFGSASEYQRCVPGPISIVAIRATDSRVVNRVSLTLADRSVSTLLYGGEIDYFTSVRLYDDL